MQTKFTVIGTASAERVIFSHAGGRHGFQVERVVKALEPVIGKAIVIEGHALCSDIIPTQRFIDLVKEGLAHPDLATHPVLLRYVEWYDQFDHAFAVVKANPCGEISLPLATVACTLEPGDAQVAD